MHEQIFLILTPLIQYTRTSTPFCSSREAQISIKKSHHALIISASTNGLTM